MAEKKKEVKKTQLADVKRDAKGRRIHKNKLNKTKKDIKAPAYDKVFIIPLRKAFEKTRPDRVPYAIRLIKRFLITHLKTENIKLGPNLNEKIWERSIQKPPRKVKVGVVKSGDKFLVELHGFSYDEFKVIAAKKDEGMAEKLAARLGGKAEKNQAEEEKIGGKASENEVRETPKENKAASKTDL
jgi:large subunit ribosomal protein L31e